MILDTSSSKVVVAVVCGGPSKERGISLNSARTLLDHLGVCEDIDVHVFYVDKSTRVHAIDPAWIYSNTPSDFEFRLSGFEGMSLEAFAQNVTATIVWPLIHGAVGEDGCLQKALEARGVSYVGMCSVDLESMYAKHNVSAHLEKNGLGAISHCYIEASETDFAEKIQSFLRANESKSYVVKPNEGGSSIGVHVVYNAKECEQAVRVLQKDQDGGVLVEPFVNGSEFTIIVLEDEANQPLALLPTQIEHQEVGDSIYSYRKKYLPTNLTKLHCPGMWSREISERICKEAEQIFSLFHCRDVVRFDGWVLEDGRIVWMDLNAVSGLEQNSFVFIQGARLGMTHQCILRYILNSALRRNKIPGVKKMEADASAKKKIFVLCGGDSSERQISLKSGCNVWLQLKNTKRFEAELYVLSGDDVWSVPYAFSLFHTVEEIVEQCQKYGDFEEGSLFDKKHKLLHSDNQNMRVPVKESLNDFVMRAKKEDSFVFLALHGGFGENGGIQKMLESHEVLFNGSRSKECALFMNKNLTSLAIKDLAIDGVSALEKYYVEAKDIQDVFLVEKWRVVCDLLGSDTLVAKPNGDGCSSGVIVLCSAQDFEKYGRVISEGVGVLEAGTFSSQPEQVSMPGGKVDLILEPFIECDVIEARQNQVFIQEKEGWVELTAGVYERHGVLHVMNASITIAEGSILSVEEKFQGGTGVNLTPPPDHILAKEQKELLCEKIKFFANRIGVRGYARIDIFFSRKTNEIIVIEVNALPGLTPSTVFVPSGPARDASHESTRVFASPCARVVREDWRQYGVA